jgi:hypothetical protein
MCLDVCHFSPTPNNLPPLGVANISRLFFVKNGDIPSAESPLFSFLKSGQNVLAGELVDGIRANVQDYGNLLAIE